MSRGSGGFARLDAGIVGALFRTELRMLLRDRRTVIVSIVLPLLVMPLLLLAGNWNERRRETRLAEREYAFSVAGPLADLARQQVEAVVQRMEQDADEKEPPFRLRFEQVEDPLAALNAGDIQFFLEAMPAGEAGEDEADADEADAEPDEGASGAGEDPHQRREEKPVSEAVPVIRVVFRADEDFSSSGALRLMRELRRQRLTQRYELVRQAGFPVDPDRVASVTESNLASAGQVTGLRLGRMLPLFVLLFVLMGGAVVATDSLAGEKERGTLETLLTTAAGRGEIVAAKLLLIFAVALAVILIQSGNFLAYVGFELVPLPEGFSLDVSPAVAGLVLLLFLPVAALCSAALLLVSGYAHSYKEAQLYFFPLMMGAMVPTLAPFLPGLSLRSAVVLVPVANISVAVKEVLIGVFDWPMLLVAWLVTAGAAVLVTRRAATLLSAERLMTPAVDEPSAVLPGPEAFRRHVLRAFAVMWAVLLIVAVNLPDETGIATQLFINVGLIFTGGSAFLIWRYRLPVKETLSLRPVRPVVWPAVLAGVPAAMLTGQGVFWLASKVFPISPEVLESFSKALLPEHLPLWALLLLIGLAPGVCEEIAFRGVLLHGIRARYGFLGVVVLNGLIFGVFHVALFRILPTAFLGMVFAAVTLLTGSIFPAMLWHTLNNMTAVLLTRSGAELGEVGPGLYLAGAAVLAVVFWVIARHGRRQVDYSEENR